MEHLKRPNKYFSELSIHFNDGDKENHSILPIKVSHELTHNDIVFFNILNQETSDFDGMEFDLIKERAIHEMQLIFREGVTIGEGCPEQGRSLPNQKYDWYWSPNKIDNIEIRYYEVETGEQVYFNPVKLK